MPLRTPAFIIRLAPFGPTVLRLGVGAIFTFHGLDKLDNGVSGFAGFLTSLNVPLPEIMAWVVTLLELVGGIALILGLGTRLLGLAFAVLMVFTIALVKADAGLIGQQGAGAELDLALLVGALALALIGPGAASVDKAVGLEPASA